MSSSKDSKKIKRYILWFTVFRIRKYINTEKLQRVFQTTLGVLCNNGILDVNESLEGEKGLLVVGTIKDSDGKVFNIEFTGIQFFGMSFLKYSFITVMFGGKLPAMIKQININNQPLIGKYFRLNFPDNFKR